MALLLQLTRYSHSLLFLPISRFFYLTFTKDTDNFDTYLTVFIHTYLVFLFLSPSRDSFIFYLSCTEEIDHLHTYLTAFIHTYSQFFLCHSLKYIDYFNTYLTDFIYTMFSYRFSFVFSSCLVFPSCLDFPSCFLFPFCLAYPWSCTERYGRFLPSNCFCFLWTARAHAIG